MMYIEKLWLVVFVVFILSGCAQGNAADNNSVGNPVATASLTADVPTTVSASRTATPRVTASPAATPSVTPAFTSTNEPVVELCTPLEDHPLVDLPGIVSDPYQPPPPGRDGRHMGTDFSYYHYMGRETPEGVRVLALLPGRVVGVLDNRIPFGFAVIVEIPGRQVDGRLLTGVDVQAGESVYVLYAHLKEMPVVTVGDEVSCGDFLGLVGQTGGEGTPYTIPHLHIEMRLGKGGASFPAMAYYDTRATDEERATYTSWSFSGEFRHFDPLIVIQNALTGMIAVTPTRTP